MKTVFKLFFAFCIFNTCVWAGGTLSPWYTQSADKKVTLNVQLFLSSACPHCQNAKDFFKDLATRSADLSIQYNIINDDKEALMRFNQLLSEQHLDDFAVPSIYFCDSRWVGFATADTTGKDLLRALNYCKQQIEKNGSLTAATVDTLRHWANANKFDSGIVGTPSVSSYIVTVAVTDAFSPCAFFCYAGFLAFLFIGGTRKRQLIAGLLFISALSLMHYFQQAHANLFYELLRWLRIPAALIGLLVVYFVIQQYKKQSNVSLYYLIAFLLGLITTAYQQTCVMNWSYIFEQWLGNQQLSNINASLYQLSYQALYILPLLITMVVYWALLNLKRFADWAARLVVIGLLFLMAIALLLVLYPVALSYISVSLVLLLLLIVLGSFLNLT